MNKKPEPDKSQKIKVGGQAIIEGVMMRSPGSLAMAVRRPDGKIVVKEQHWMGLSERFKFLKWPFLRGTVVLIESLTNGISALTFSANQAAIAEEEMQQKEAGSEDKDDDSDGGLSALYLAGTVIVALGLAIVLFVVVPHALTAAIGHWAGDAFDVTSGWFHLIDGIIKFLMFLIYVYSISRLKDIRRVFEYHGAEHKSIFTYEAGLPLRPEKAREFTTKHPRCGTSFLMVVLSVSIILFSASFVLMPKFPGMNIVLKHLIYILIKMPLLIPIAGVSYEVIQLAGKRQHNRLLQLAVLPGIWFQKITTQEPSDDQVEVAMVSLLKVLWREQNGSAGGLESEEIYDDFQSAVQAIGYDPVRAET